MKEEVSVFVWFRGGSVMNIRCTRDFAESLMGGFDGDWHHQQMDGKDRLTISSEDGHPIRKFLTSEVIAIAIDPVDDVKLEALNLQKTLFKKLIEETNKGEEWRG